MSTTDFEDTVTKLTALAESLRGIQEMGVAQYTPVVETILRTRSRDVRHIEHTLDYLLDFACHPAGLELYRRLCRHYWDIDPAATAAYVNAYREMWDTEDEEDEPPMTISPTIPAPIEPAFPAPTVRPMTAQGNALGSRRAPIQALKGRPKTACRVIAPAREFIFPSTFIPQPSSLP